MAHKDQKERKKSRASYLVFSLIIAIIIWNLVAFTTDTDITKKVSNVKVSYVGQQELKERGYVVLGTPEDLDLWVKLSGHRENIIGAIDRVKVELDLSGITGAGECELEGSVKTYNSQVSVVKKSFSTIPVRVEAYTEKEIPIEVHQIGSFKNNPVLSEPEFGSIKISGAESEINRVEAGYVTVDLARLSGGEVTSSGIVLTDSLGEVITDAKTIEGTAASMTITNTVYEYAELPVKPILSKAIDGTAELDEENTEIDPETVKIGILPGYSFSEVKAVIDLYTTDEVKAELQAEEGMYIPEDEKEVTIKPVFRDRTEE